MSIWQTIPLCIANQQIHIERSEQFLQAIQPTDPPLLYWSLAEVEGVVLGFSQKETVLNQERVQELKLPIYHRRAGGTAVLVGSHLLALDVVLPASHPLIESDIVESYRWFGEAWVATLACLGVETRTVPPVEARALRTRLKDPETRTEEQLLNRACYGTLSPYEVAVGQRKIVGLDMIRRRTGTLLQAGLLLDWQTETLAALLGHNHEEEAFLRQGLHERAVGLHTLTGTHFDPQEIISLFENIVLQWESANVN